MEIIIERSFKQLVEIKISICFVFESVMGPTLVIYKMMSVFRTYLSIRACWMNGIKIVLGWANKTNQK